MHRILITATLTSSMLIAGCRSTPASSTPPESGLPGPVAPSGPSLAEMNVQWTKLRQQYVADCLSGTPDHIRSTQALCEKERQAMAPLGNAITAAELTAAHQTNP